MAETGADTTGLPFSDWHPARLAFLHAVCFSRPRAWSAAEFTGLLGSPGVFLCGAAAGFVMGRVVADEAEVLTLAVAPPARRAGTGRALLAAFEAAALARGAMAAFLEVAADNRAALALYDRAGYVSVGRRRGYFGPGLDGLVLRKSLAPRSACKAGDDVDR